MTLSMVSRQHELSSAMLNRSPGCPPLSILSFSGAFHGKLCVPRPPLFIANHGAVRCVRATSAPYASPITVRCGVCVPRPPLCIANHGAVCATPAPVHRCAHLVVFGCMCMCMCDSAPVCAGVMCLLISARAYVCTTVRNRERWFLLCNLLNFSVKVPEKFNLELFK